jgi:hypothetical protein
MLSAHCTRAQGSFLAMHPTSCTVLQVAPGYLPIVLWKLSSKYAEAHSSPHVESTVDPWYMWVMASRRLLLRKICKCLGCIELSTVLLVIGHFSPQCCSTSAKYAVLQQISNFHFIIEIKHIHSYLTLGLHLLLGMQLSTKVRAGKHSVDHTKI